MEVFTLIARKKNVALVFVSYLLVALAAISLLTICIGFAQGIFLPFGITVDDEADGERTGGFGSTTEKK